MWSERISKEEAFCKFKLCAEKSNAQACAVLGNAFRFGIPDLLEKNNEFAAIYCERALALGWQDPLLYLNLGDLAYMKKDYQAAVRWYKKGAKKDEATCLQNLGHLLYHGEGVKKNPIKAVELWKRGAKLQHPQCIENLGLAYRMGEGVEKNENTGIIYSIYAAELGFSPSIAFINSPEIQQYIEKKFGGLKTIRLWQDMCKLGLKSKG